MGAFLLAVFGAVCWGIAPVFGKIGLKGTGPLDGLAARTIITVLLVAGWVIGSGRVGRIFTIPSRRWYFLAAEAFLATFAGDLAYYAALKRGNVGQTALVMAASPLITLVIAWCFLGETLSATKLAGAVFIIAGVTLVGLQALR